MGDSTTAPITLVMLIGTILIAIYIMTVVAGGISRSADDIPAVNQTSRWGTTFDQMDQMGGAGMSLAAIIPMVLVGIGVMTLVIMKFKMG